MRIEAYCVCKFYNTSPTPNFAMGQRLQARPRTPASNVNSNVADEQMFQSSDDERRQSIRTLGSSHVHAIASNIWNEDEQLYKRAREPRREVRSRMGWPTVWKGWSAHQLLSFKSYTVQYALSCLLHMATRSLA
jgi:hypothetical protein